MDACAVAVMNTLFRGRRERRYGEITREDKSAGRVPFPRRERNVVGPGKADYVALVQRLITVLGVALLLAAAQAAPNSAVPVPANEALPALASSLASRLAGKALRTPGGSDVVLGALLDAGRTETCLRTIAQGGGWPASWLIVSDSTRPYDLVIRIALAPDGTIADPDTAFLATRREWDDASFDAAFRTATGKKPPREKQRNVVIQSFTKKIVTEYVYDLPATGPGAKGLLAILPEGSLIREAPAIDLRDGKRHTLVIVLIRPRFVPADCSTEEGRRVGHRDSGGVLLALAGETELEDQLDITEVVRAAAGAVFLPRFACQPSDVEPGAIDALVDSRFEGREPVRLLDLSGRVAQSPIAGVPVSVGIKKVDGAFKLFAK